MPSAPENTEPPALDTGAQPLLGRYLRLADRLYSFIMVRSLVAVSIVAGALFAHYVVGIRNLRVIDLIWLAVALGLVNLITWLVVRPFHRVPERTLAARHFLIGVLNVSIATDFIALTVALWLVGGPKSPFQAFFIFHVIIASVLLSRRAVLGHALFGYLLFAMLTLGMWQGWLSTNYPEGAVPSDKPLDGRFVLTVLTVQGLLFAFTGLLVTYMMRLIRLGERQLVTTNQELDRLSEQRRDFLHIALHNLRAPVSAASMWLSNLQEGYGGPLTAQQDEWLGRSRVRLKELTAFLQDLESLAALEAGALAKQVGEVDLADLLRGLVEENQDLAQQRRHALSLEIEDGTPYVRGIHRLLREAIVNFITNAIKYTPEGGTIAVRAHTHNGWVRIEVHDTGIGIPEADQHRLFHQFVRLHQQHPEMSQVGGSGLGLYIVRQIIDAHDGRFEVHSREGQGSTFVIELPAIAKGT